MSLTFLPVTTLELQSAFLDKTTGLQLAGGLVFFWQDINRNNPKAVYQQTGSPGAYTYTALPNPVQLSNAGTFMDNSGNDISVYYWPYTGTPTSTTGVVDNYYVQVFAAPGPLPPFPPLGTPELTRENVPGLPAGMNTTTGPSNTANDIVNSQFSQVYFNPAVGYSPTYSAGVTTFPIAPGWSIQVTAAGGGGTLTVNRVSIAGATAAATNPPYALSVTAGTNITQLILIQTLANNPNIFASTNPPGTAWLAAGIALAPNTLQSVILQYAPQGVVDVPIGAPSLLDVNNPAGVWQYFTATTQVNLAANPITADTGFTNLDIILPFSPGTTTTLSSVQLVGLASDVMNVPYDQQSVVQQVGDLGFFNNPLLAYKPTLSYLLGWDFPLNPAQTLGAGTSGSPLGPFATGVNTGNYFWDQTILFQTIDNSISAYRETNGGLTIKASLAGQVAMIQYLDQTTARKILSDRASVHISASTTHALGLAGNVTLWACTSGSGHLPTLPTTAISALSATGVPTMGNGTWTQVPNLYQNTSFILQAASATNSESVDISLNGWDMQNAVPTNTAVFFAIVVGFAPLIINDTITVNSISLCPGDIATRPAPKTYGETLFSLQNFYWKTFQPGTIPATMVGALTGEFLYDANFGPGSANEISHSLSFPTPMRTTPTVTFYSPVNNDNQVYNQSRGGHPALTGTTTYMLTPTAIAVTANNGAAGTTAGDTLAVHITASARFGVEN